MTGVLDWLLAGEPAIRWQALRDLADADPAEVARARAEVAREGTAAEVLAAQRGDGAWQHGDAPAWLSTLTAMRLLRVTGVDPDDAAMRAAIARLAAGFRWDVSFGAKPFFGGEVEPCINGGALATGAYVGAADDALAQRLVGDQLADGGWNCDAPPSTVGSFHSTLCVLEGLAAYERAHGAAVGIADARARGERYLLERDLFRRRSTGAVADEGFLRFAIPTRYQYDVLRALDYLRETGAAPDPRVADAIVIVLEKRRPDGTWLLDVAHHDGLAASSGEAAGAPSRWITLRALRVLRWARG